MIAPVHALVFQNPALIIVSNIEQPRFQGRGVIELDQVRIADNTTPLAESQDGFPVHRLTRLPGGRLRQCLPFCQLLTVQNCSHYPKQVGLQDLKTLVTSTHNTYTYLAHCKNIETYVKSGSITEGIMGGETRHRQPGG